MRWRRPRPRCRTRSRRRGRCCRRCCCGSRRSRCCWGWGRRRSWCWRSCWCSHAVSAASVAAVISAPDDHFGVGPHCRALGSASGRVGGAGRCPTVGAGIVSPAGIQIMTATIEEIPAPDDHFGAGPHCRVKVSASGRVGGAGSCPTVGAGIVSPASVQIVEAVIDSAPDDHFAAGQHCRVKVSGSGRIGGAGSCPTVGAGIVSPAGVQRAERVV